MHHCIISHWIPVVTKQRILAARGRVMNHSYLLGYKDIIMNKYTRKYPYIIGLFKICIITVHAHAVDTSLSLPTPPPPPTHSEGL